MSFDYQEPSLSGSAYNQESLRKRLIHAGVEALADHELIALLLMGGRRQSAGDGPLGLAIAALEHSGGLQGLARLELGELVRLTGLRFPKACLFKVATELGRRIAIPAPPVEKPIGCAADVAGWYRCRLQDKERECIHALLLDSKHRPLKSICVAEGSWTSCAVDPKVIFSACLRNGAPAVILVHNHPSGDPVPSRDDLDLTERVVRAGQVIGVRVLDHLIVARGGFCSLADAGLL